ncbi:zinc finger, RING-CH-type, zinc finger, RING/FYVE/PHD-type containing protein, partial [Tanacetum coccineum]
NIQLYDMFVELYLYNVSSFMDALLYLFNGVPFVALSIDLHFDLILFAHRKCIQKWCNKKGDITCEICNQVYSPDYTLPPTRINPDVMTIDIRHAWGPQMNLRDAHFLAFASGEHRFLEPDYEEFDVASNSSIAYLRYMALILMIILLVRQALLVTRDLGMVPESSKFFKVSSGSKKIISGIVDFG